MKQAMTPVQITDPAARWALIPDRVWQPRSANSGAFQAHRAVAPAEPGDWAYMHQVVPGFSTTKIVRGFTTTAHVLPILGALSELTAVA